MCSSFVNARIDVSSMPVTLPAAAVRRLIATATASSSSSSSGGSDAPTPSRYPPATPGEASTGYPRLRRRSTSRRTVRTSTSSRLASSAPDQS